MRITGGKLNGRVLRSVKGLNIRPTSSKIRQAVFNIIGNDISEFRVIDIFAGTGIMGIEALSRGAAWTLFFDNSDRSIELIKKNLEICGFGSKGYVIKKDLKEGLPQHEKIKKESVDLAFIDPPYGKNLIPGILESIVNSKILACDAIIITESIKKDQLPERVGNFFLSKTKAYGDSKIDIYNRVVK